MLLHYDISLRAVLRDVAMENVSVVLPVIDALHVILSYSETDASAGHLQIYRTVSRECRSRNAESSHPW